MRLVRNLLLFALMLLAGISLAAPRGGLRVERAWARATPPMATVAAAYLVVINDSGTPDRLLRIDSAIAQSV